MAAGDVLFADGDETYDLIVLIAGTADIIEGHGHPGTSVLASYGPSEFLGEIGMLTGQRAFLSAVATSAGRVLAVPVAQLRRVMAQEPRLKVEEDRGCERRRAVDLSSHAQPLEIRLLLIVCAGSSVLGAGRWVSVVSVGRLLNFAATRGRRHWLDR